MNASNGQFNVAKTVRKLFMLATCMSGNLFYCKDLVFYQDPVQPVGAMQDRQDAADGRDCYQGKQV